ncbi:MAG: calcium/sodium antiporter [Gammaproteobacteria bacterium]|nr:calcium/sodium antiporter [Gammaproteobacteria bacterium]
MLLYFLAVLTGIPLLVWSADRFVGGASAIATRTGISPLVVGLTIVAFGSSAPEMLVSVNAALSDNGALAIGNAVGSNIANIALVLGLTALVRPLRVNSQILQREFPLMLLVTLLATALLMDYHLGQIDGLLLISTAVGIIGWLVYTARHTERGDPLGQEVVAAIPKGVTRNQALFSLGVGLLVLIGSAKLLVWGAVGIASWLGVSDLIIGLTLVAIGTSLPEVAASLAGVLRNEDDIALGNVIGSNIANILVVVGIPGLISPAAVDGAVLHRDLPVMLLLSVGLLILIFRRRRSPIVERWHGMLFLSAYLAYLFLLAKPG